METFAVAKQDEGMLRMSCDKFAVENAQQTDFLIREFLELNRDQASRIKNSAFLLGLNKIPNYAILTADIDESLGRARTKGAEKWIEKYKALSVASGRPILLDPRRAQHFKKVLARIYEILKNFIKQVDLEKLFDDNSENRDLGYLLDIVKGDENEIISVSAQQLEYDLREMDLLLASKRTGKDSPDMLSYIKGQTRLVEEFGFFLSKEIAFVNESQT